MDRDEFETSVIETDFELLRDKASAHVLLFPSI